MCFKRNDDILSVPVFVRPQPLIFLINVFLAVGLVLYVSFDPNQVGLWFRIVSNSFGEF